MVSEPKRWPYPNLVEFKVSSAQEAYAAIASVAEALRAMLKQTIGGHQSNVCGLYALAAD